MQKHNENVSNLSILYYDGLLIILIQTNLIVEEI